MRRRFLHLLICANLSIFSISARWTEYTVAASEACARAQAAVAGDVITVLPGDAGKGCWVSEKNGSASAPITLKAQTPGTVWFTGSTATRKDAFTLYKSSWWRIDGIGFRDAENAGLRISSSDHTTLTNITCKDNREFGMLTGGASSYGIVTDSTFIGSQVQHGAYVSTPNTRDWTFLRCTFAFNARAGIQLNSQGASGAAITNCRIESSSLNNNGLAKEASAINCLGVQNSVFAGLTINDGKAGGISFGPNGRIGGESSGNVVNSCVITFRPGEGRACVQQNGGQVSVANCRLWAGKTVVQVITVLNGAVLVQSGNVILPPPSPIIATPVIDKPTEVTTVP